MKKLFASLLVICLFVLPLCACTQPTGEETSTPPSQSDGTDNFQNLTVIDNSECVITILDAETDPLWGYTLNVSLENKSLDKTYLFSVVSAAVNGVQTDTLFSAEVIAEKKAVEGIHFTDPNLEKNGITDFTDIELTFRVYDNDGWTADPVAEGTAHIYPQGQDKAALFVWQSTGADQVIVDNDYVTVTVTGYEDNAIWGYIAHVFLQNKTDKELMFTVDDVAVNDYMADPYWATSVTAGKCAFSAIIWPDSVLDASGITDIDKIEFLLRVYDNDDWLSDDLVSEQITLNP